MSEQRPARSGGSRRQSSFLLAEGGGGGRGVLREQAGAGRTPLVAVGAARALDVVKVDALAARGAPLADVDRVPRLLLELAVGVVDHRLVARHGRLEHLEVDKQVELQGDRQVKDLARDGGEVLALEAVGRARRRPQERRQHDVRQERQELIVVVCKAAESEVGA